MGYCHLSHGRKKGARVRQEGSVRGIRHLCFSSISKTLLQQLFGLRISAVYQDKEDE